MNVSVIIVNWNTCDLLHSCLESIYMHTTDVDFDVWVVDNGSTDGSADMVRERFPGARMIANGSNLGFSRANNQAISASRSEYVLLLNSDTELKGNILDTLVRTLEEHPEAGAVGCRLLNPDGSLQLSCGRFPRLSSVFLGGVLARTIYNKLFPGRTFFAEYGFTEEEHGRACEADFVLGACLLLRREALRQAGLFDERIFLYFEEIELCYRLKRHGWKVLYTPDAAVLHWGGQSSRSSKDMVRQNLVSQEYFFRKHHGRACATALKLIVLTSSAIKVVLFLGLILLPRKNHRQFARLKLTWHFQSLCWSASNLFLRAPCAPTQPGRTA